MNIKTTAAFILACLTALPARAIELSLAENRQETGHIGFIDMQRLFKQFPETIRAKENFEEVVRQAEEQVNVRKVELIHLRNELSQLKIERKLMDQLPATVVTAPPPAAKTAPAPKPVPAPAPAPAPVAVSSAPAPAAPMSRGAAFAAASTVSAVPPAAHPSTPTVAMATVAPPTKPVAHPVAALPGFGEASSDMPGESFGWKAGASSATAAAAQVAVAKPASQGPAPSPAQAPAPKAEPLVINIPGVSTAPIVVQPPVAQQPVTAVASKTAPAAEAASSSATASVAPTSAGLSADKRAEELADMDAKIALKQKDLDRKEEDFKQYQAEAEKNLLDLESRKTEILLGKIHKAIEDVARQEGVSVVVDKTSILYGHDAVDLTDKVLKYLKSS